MSEPVIFTKKSIHCSTCNAQYLETGDLYFNRVSIIGRKTDELPVEIYTCHECLKFYYETVIPDLIKTYKGDPRTCQETNSIKTKSEPIFSRLKHFLRLRG